MLIISNNNNNNNNSFTVTSALVFDLQTGDYTPADKLSQGPTLEAIHQQLDSPAAALAENWENLLRCLGLIPASGGVLLKQSYQ